MLQKQHRVVVTPGAQGQLPDFLVLCELGQSE